VRRKEVMNHVKHLLLAGVAICAVAAVAGCGSQGLSGAQMSSLCADCGQWLGDEEAN
jgi:hypothetical protein